MCLVATVCPCPITACPIDPWLAQSADFLRFHRPIDVACKPLSVMCDSIALATNGCFLTRITPLANSAAMSLCLASWLTIYLLSECLDLSQNPTFRRRETQRGVCRKRNQAARVKSLRDCRKQVRPEANPRSARHSVHDQPRCTGGCLVKGSQR